MFIRAIRVIRVRLNISVISFISAGHNISLQTSDILKHDLKFLCDK